MPPTPKPSQRRRHIAITTPLGQDELLLNRFTLRERLGSPFEIDADLCSLDHQIDISKVVGHAASIRLEMKPHGTRVFNGYVSRFVQNAGKGRYARYQATIVPWLWFLTRTSDCRVFQRKSVLEIAEEVFNAHRFGSDFYEIRLKNRYARRRYCVQYRETDFNFIHRLFETEGIFYWFEHKGNRHRMILADSIGASQPVEGFEKLKFNVAEPGTAQGRTDISEWTAHHEVQPVAYRLKDFDFKKPSDPLLDGADIRREHGMARFAMYDYPGEYYEPKEAKRYAQLRLEELQARHEVLQGVTAARGIGAGNVFELAGHPREDQNRKHLVTDITLTADAGEFETDDRGEEFFSSHFSAIPSTTPFRPARATPKPIIQGIQTATVVGKKGKEVDPDDYGRVKVQFHWDRYGKKDENSSCWVRVSQPWAGKGYGSMNIPRIGQEVVVEFLEGDPDRPLINGRLYHGENMPHATNAGRDGKKGNVKPSGIAAASMMTSFKSSSLGGSGGHNEITMNDAAGAEGLFLKAQKDEIHKVGNDRERTVGNNESVKVGNNRTKDIGVDETNTIGANRTETVGANETITIKGNRIETVNGMETYTVNQARLHSVMISENILNGLTRSIQTGVAHLEVIGLLNVIATGMTRANLVGLSDTTIVLGGSSFNKTSTTYTINAGSDFIVEAGANLGLKAGGIMVLECPDITLKAGGGFIRINGDGVTIVGTKIKLNSGGAPKSLPKEQKGGGAAGAGGGGGSSIVAPPTGETGLFGKQTADLLKKIGAALKNIPGLKIPSTLDGIIDALGSGKMPEFGQLLGMIPKEFLSPALQQALAVAQKGSQLTDQPTGDQKGSNPPAGGAIKNLADPSQQNSEGAANPGQGISAEEGQKVADKAGALANDYDTRGVSYEMGGSAANGGSTSDCSHFVHHTMQDSGVDVPYESTSTIGSSTSYTEIPASQVRPGDVVVQGGHMGISTGAVDASGNSTAVQMGNHGAKAGKFGPDGWFEKNKPTKHYRPKGK